MSESPDPISNGHAGYEPVRRRRKRRHKAPRNALSQKNAEQVAALVEQADNERRRRAVEMRLQGKSYTEIADTLGIAYNSAVRMILFAMRQDIKADEGQLAEVRQLEIGRLDALWQRFFPLATDEERPSLAAATFLLKVAKRRAELVGLDQEIKAPQITAVVISPDQIAQVSAMAQDPTSAEVLERLAAVYAHGDEALEADYEELGTAALGDGVDDLADDEDDGDEGDDIGDDEADEAHVTG